MARARCFLPEMEKADKKLKKLLSDEQSKERLDIESVQEGETCIEMVTQRVLYL